MKYFELAFKDTPGHIFCAEIDDARKTVTITADSSAKTIKAITVRKILLQSPQIERFNTGDTTQPNTDFSSDNLRVFQDIIYSFFYTTIAESLTVDLTHNVSGATIRYDHATYTIFPYTKDYGMMVFARGTDYFSIRYDLLATSKVMALPDRSAHATGEQDKFLEAFYYVMGEAVLSPRDDIEIVFTTEDKSIAMMRLALRSADTTPTTTAQAASSDRVDSALAAPPADEDEWVDLGGVDSDLLA